MSWLAKSITKGPTPSPTANFFAKKNIVRHSSETPRKTSLVSCSFSFSAAAKYSQKNEAGKHLFYDC